MAITIYGSPRSRTMRVLWLAAELDLQYIHVPYEFDDPMLKQPEFLQLNEAGAIPTIVDGDFVLSESLAINIYLAKKYGSGGPSAIYPSTIESEASVMRWSLFAQGHLEPWVQKDLLLEDLLTAIGKLGRGMISQSLAVLDRALANKDWLVNGKFTVADLNVAGVLSPSRSQDLELSEYANVANWLAHCYSRPAAISTRQHFS